MSNDFWLKIWEKAETRFHQQDFNRYLIENFSKFKLKKGANIFVPLCGKSKDLLWLSQQGYQVTGVELSPLACHDFFIENKLAFEINKLENFTIYKSNKVEIYCGDIFNLNLLNTFDFIYDRAALVALAEDQRILYAKKLASFSKKGSSMLLLSFESNLDCGPPYSVEENEVKGLLGEYFKLKLLARNLIDTIPPHLFELGYSKMHTAVYLLERY